MHLRHPGCLKTVLSFSLVFSTSIGGQVASPEFGGGPPSNFSVPLSGQIIAAASLDLNRLRVQLVLPGGRGIVAESSPSSFGSFELPPAPNGLYELRIITIHGVLIHTLSVSLPYANTLEIDLTQGNSNSGTGHPVSLARMQHKIPKQAQKQAAAAQDASRKGKPQEAIAYLEKAIAIDPFYFEAINNLGVQFVRLGEFEQACRLFTRATEIDPSDPFAEMNLAFALLSLHRFPEAEQAARASLRSDPRSPRARFYLAISLLEQNEANKEALFHLAKAADQFEPAKKLLAQLNSELKK